MTKMLMDELELDEADVYHMPAEMDYTDLWTVHGLNLPDLKFAPWQPVVPARLAGRRGGPVQHHPQRRPCWCTTRTSRST